MMKNLQELFEHQLKDLYSAESQLLNSLPKMEKHATDEKLKDAFRTHLKETKEQHSRLEDVFKKLGLKSGGKKCKAMEGLIKETESFIEETKSKDVINAGLIAEAQRVEHYEISGYGTAVRYAKELGHKEIANILQSTLDEEYEANKNLSKLAESRLNKKAID